MKIEMQHRNAEKAILKGKFIAINVYLKKQEIS